MLILRAETELLAREVASKAGKLPDEVVHEAVVASARQVGVPSAPATETADDRAKMIEAARAIARRAAARPLLDDRSEDAILGYDRHGIPA